MACRDADAIYILRKGQLLRPDSSRFLQIQNVLGEEGSYEFNTLYETILIQKFNHRITCFYLASVRHSNDGSREE